MIVSLMFPFFVVFVCFVVDSLPLPHSLSISGQAGGDKLHPYIKLTSYTEA